MSSKSQTNKGDIRSLKGYIYIYIYGVHLGLSPHTSLGGFHPLSSLSLSLPALVRLLPQSYLGPYLYLHFFYCAYIFNSLGICAQDCMLYLHVLFLRDMCTNSICFDPQESLG